MNIRKLLLAGAASAVAIGGAAAQEQTQPAPSRPSSGASDAGEIVVTAEKRSASIQDVPVAVTAFTAAVREEAGIISAQQQLNFTPGVLYTEGSGRVSIRGVGRTTDQFGTDPGVAVYTDGFYVPSVLGIGGSTLRQARTEVLRGPQGTLYGRNSIGGAINAISRRPDDEFTAEVRGAINDFSGSRFEGRVSGPITEHVRASFSTIIGQQDDGYFHNTCEGSVTPPCQSFDEGGVYESWDAELQVSYDLGPRFDGWIRYYTTDSTSNPRTAGYISPYAVGRLDSTVNPTYGGVGNSPLSPSYLDPNSNPGIRDPRLFTSNLQSESKIENYGLFVTEQTFHADSFDIKYIGGYQHYDNPAYIDGDATGRTPFTYDGVSCINATLGSISELGLGNTAAVVAALEAGALPAGQSFASASNYAGYLDSIYSSTFAAFDNPLGFLLGGDAPVFNATAANAYDCDTDAGNGVQFGQQVVQNDLKVGASTARNAFSHEFNISSTGEGPFQWLVGLYYYESDDQGIDNAYSYRGQPEVLNYFNPADPSSPLSNPDSALYLFSTDLVVKSQAVFTQLDYDISDTLHASFGLRYSEDEKTGFEDNTRQVFWLPFGIANDGSDPSHPQVDLDGDGNVDPIYLNDLDGVTGPSYQAFGPASGAGSRTVNDTWGAMTGAAGLQWTPNDDTMVYGRYSRGYKSGGFNLGTFLTQFSVDEETIDAYELGWKQSWEAFQFNAALFFYQYHDLQVAQAEVPAPGVVTSKLVNMPEVESRGFEIESIWDVSDSFRIMANYTYLDTEIVEAPLFIDAHDPEAIRPGAQPSGPPIPVGPLVPPAQPQMVVGNNLPAAPKHKFGLVAMNTWHLDQGDVTLATTVNWRDDSYYTIFNTPDFTIDAGTTVDLTATWRSTNDRFALIGSVTNVFDENNKNGFTTLPPNQNFFQISYLEPPRVMTLEAQVRW